jgi:cytochrome b561/polyisoprenoid-binding protein YceI
MTAQNTPAAYGSIARTFHWLTALLILSAIALGLVADALPYGTSAELARKAQVFSLHKTLGIAAFAVAVLRILWALTQVRPTPLHPDRRLETILAEAVHWALYIALVAAPLSGWLHHAATDGFAPILWPFGQSLPLVPKDPRLAEILGALHWVFTKVLIAAVALHVAGALKHTLWDRDGTLSRMWSGRAPTAALAAPPVRASRRRAPAVAALALWAAALGVGLIVGRGSEAPAAVPLDRIAGEWTVTEGTLAFSVRQMGADVEGQFAGWTAAIAFAPETGTGEVTVTIAIGSLTLGSVTGQALGPDFFASDRHPTATFRATIRPEGTRHVADGTLTLKGVTMPVTLPFDLALDGDTARMSGTVTLDRRDFGIGAALGDESQLGFAVSVSPSLTAVRTTPAPP